MDAANTLYQQGREAMAAGRFEEAVTLFTQSVAACPHFKSLELLGECLINTGRLQEAVVPLAAAATLNAGVRAPALLAEVFLQLAQRHDAERVAEIALCRDPANKMAFHVKQALAPPESTGSATGGRTTVGVDYRPINTADYEQVRVFLSENGWAHRVADPERFAKMLDNTDRTIVAWDAGQVVGFARALCDGVSNGLLSMVAVAENRRGQGIGREMVRRLMGDDPGITWTLRAGRGSEGFWRKIGFAASEIAMEKTRQ